MTFSAFDLALAVHLRIQLVMFFGPLKIFIHMCCVLHSAFQQGFIMNNKHSMLFNWVRDLFFLNSNTQNGKSKGLVESGVINKVK